MSDQRDPFFPHHVDESIEQLASTNRFDGASHERERIDPNERLVRDMQQLYSLEQKRYQQALRRVENRLVEQHIARGESSVTAPVLLGQEQGSPSSREIQGRLHKMKHTLSSGSGTTRLGQRVNMLVAVLVVAVLVGSLVAVLSLTHQKTTTGQGPIATPTTTIAPTPTVASSFGKTLYTMSSQSGFNQLAWSFDSKRVASVFLNNSVQIWDATTGNHLVKVSLPAGAVPSGLAWSPVGQQVAIGTNKSLLVVNGQTGAIVYIYPYSAALASVNTTAAGAPLSARIPISSGAGFGIPVWSPDGKLIAVTVFNFDAKMSNKILVWNPQTNAVVFEIAGSTSGTAVVGAQHHGAAGGPLPGTQDIRVDSWSPDGQYLSGLFSSTGNDPYYIAVWKVSTRQLVFKMQLNPHASIIGPIWQPHSDNLTFAQSDTSSDSTLEIWNILTRSQIKHYSLDVDQVLVWSPDGKYLAYVNTYSATWVNIIDASSGQPVYIYKGHEQPVDSLAWSPNGKYIVSGEMALAVSVAKVWTAE